MTAAQIAERALRSNALTWTNARARVRMVSIAANGERAERSMDVIGRKRDGLYQSVVRVLSPREIAGTAFLMVERGKNESEQYLYLPALKRTRRIASRERHDSFMGSDFSYADLQGVDPKDAEHVRLPDETIGGDAYYVIDSTIHPGAKLAYGKVTSFIRQSDAIAMRTRFYDRSGSLEKTLYCRRIRIIEGTPVVVEARMQSERTKHVTEMFVESIEHRDDLTDAQFTPAALEHL